jgi:hypothetical protein
LESAIRDGAGEKTLAIHGIGIGIGIGIGEEPSVGPERSKMVVKRKGGFKLRIVRRWLPLCHHSNFVADPERSLAFGSNESLTYEALPLDMAVSIARFSRLKETPKPLF